MNTQSQPERRSPLIWGWLMLVMLVAGAAIPAQGRVNAELGAEIGDAVLAAAISFTTGSLVMVLLVALLPQGRRTLRNVRPALRRGTVKWWYFLAGCVGGYFVLTQTLTIALIGVAVYTIAVVTGQTIGGLLWDRIGLGPAGRKRLNGVRVGGALLTVAAVSVAVSPQLAQSGRGVDWLLLVLLPLTAGFLQAAQQAVNGRQSAAYGGPLPGTLINFLAGSAALILAWGVMGLFGNAHFGLSPVWWHYLGGPLGIVFIALGAYLVTQVGVLLAAMGMIAGQLLGSLLLDLVVPAPGSVVTALTVVGTVLTLLAVVVASLPDFYRGKGNAAR
ncbi:DMT family transporter [Nesterenkonia flava]|uniref:DMT family transporter n=1 Tax=Nesterenkonia flava TaxID=469799 RepID=A0ABU1FT95_9MICC|nr:DMT family transporter [Nesterenkonia flava]MDR5711833.1 DMT family transporter [Nesterenkonia flava]